MTQTPAFLPCDLHNGCPEPLPAPIDSCGIGYIAKVDGRPSHRVLKLALEALGNHSHRGAVAADGKTGDGAGVMTQVPHPLFSRVYQRITGNQAPIAADLAVGMVFMPLTRAGARSRCRRVLEESLRHHELEPLGWREVPIELEAVGPRALASRPHIQQIFVARGDNPPGDPFEQALYLARRRAERLIREEGIDEFYVVSLSHRTIVYKGLCMADQLGHFYPDLEEPDYASAVVLFHQRYSTNTFSTWKLAHPFRLLCHNGEINTLQGNKTWMRARERALHCEGTDPAAIDLTPVIDPGLSDSGTFDNVLEFFVKRGRPLLPSVLMMLPEMWENIPGEDIPEGWRDLYRYMSCLMEPWDGPAAISFFDGRVVGTVLDRNGLRPVRYSILESGLVISASEAGVVSLDDEEVVRHGQLGPGEILVVDLDKGKVFTNHELKQQLADARPYREWYRKRVQTVPPDVFYDRASERKRSLLAAPAQKDILRRRQLAFGYTSEDEIAVLRPMVMHANEPIGSMGDDTPPSVLSRMNRPFFHFFRQRFAQVTNPAIDPLRERVVMSLRTLLGRRANILTEEPETTHLLELPGPILSRAAFEHLNSLDPVVYPHITLRSCYPVHGGAESLQDALGTLCHDAEVAVRQGASLVTLYDGELNPFRAPIPSLLAVSAIHQHLIDCGLRLRASLVVASGEPREVHHFACLLGFGADAIYPFLALETITAMVADGGRQMEGLDPADAHLHFVESVEKGLLKIMAKMGIAELSSYRGAQVFEALGLCQEFVDAYFPGTASLLGGAGLDAIAARVAACHYDAYGELMAEDLKKLASYGFYKYKKGGEQHRWSPKLVRKLHQALSEGERLLQKHQEQSPFAVLPQGPPGYLEFAAACNGRPPAGIRDLLGFVKHRPPLSLDEVEPAGAIVARFSTGAMSHGSLSAEAHETLAVAMNRLGGASNSGEGGEDEGRFGTDRNSRIKQVASGRFGVTPAYLISGKELQIKVSQGSKPGEGGQLPGHKVSREIARIRHTTPGVALISPPPHHDIYSIEDLAQLIYDLKRLNGQAEVSVKLVAEDGVGTVAAGVAKGFADVIHISGSDGGTGASPLSSIKFAGMPWELGLSQAQQVLVNNRLRGNVRLRVDGGFQTGRDVLVAALLGADQFSFGTSALVAEGCLMARTCHTNRCPVGIASQRPELRAKFPGTPESVMAYMLGVAHEVRVLLAEIGCRSLDEVIGRTELLEQVVFGEPAGNLDLSPLLWRPPDDLCTYHGGGRNDPPQRGRDLDLLLIEQVRQSQRPDGLLVIGEDAPVPIFNTDRTVGARLSGWIARDGGGAGLPSSVRIRFEGTAGQSFGAFGVEGLELELWGGANDYVGKSLSGGVLVIRPGARQAHLKTSENAIVGNTVLYGATGGRLFAAGRAAQRFCVRNSGATAVVEGVGEHACEYMTGGTVVVLGRVGRNFGAGMTGGVAYLYDEDGLLQWKLNPELVEAVPVDRDDELRRLVQLHFDKTGSNRAREMLDDWASNLARFRLVRPRATVATIEAHNEGVEEEERVA